MTNNHLNVETPIGTLQFRMQVSEGNVKDIHLSECNIEPIIPDGMSVQGCTAVLLKCVSETLLNNVVFSCSWKNLKEKGYGASGEGLDAWEWESNKTLVMVGTEDDIYLGSRVKLKESTTNYYPVTMQNNKIKIHVSQFPENEELTLHYVISWNSIPEKTNSSCWYAVDIPHDRVLQECN